MKGWNDVDYFSEIQILKDLVLEFNSTFDQIDSKLNMNMIESFNHTRKFQADKNVAWRSSWKTRAYISILKWNDPNYEITIFNAFGIQASPQMIYRSIQNNSLK